MALPKIDLPIMEVELPSNGKKVKIRPFTVKEEKILLVAQESDEPAAEMLAIKQILTNCVIDANVEELPVFDMEFLLLKLRSISVDNKVEFAITDPETEEAVTLSIDVDEVNIATAEGHTNEIKINDDYTLFLKYPNVDSFIRINQLDGTDPLTTYFIMTSCLDYIASEDEIEYFKDYTDKEIEQFMDELPGKTLNKIVNFFETMPRLKHELKYTNKNGNEQTFVVEGTRSFFI